VSTRRFWRLPLGRRSGFPTTRWVNPPPNQHRQQNERDEASDERPEHAHTISGDGGCCERSTARELPVVVTARPARRAVRPVRWRTGTPTQPAAGAPGGTRTASDWVAGALRAARGETLRKVRPRKPHTEGSCEKSSLRSVLCLTRAPWPCAQFLRPCWITDVPPTRSIKAKISPGRNGGWRKTLEFSDGLNTCKLRVSKVLPSNLIAFSGPFQASR
jgi:hypothetical protein